VEGEFWHREAEDSVVTRDELEEILADAALTLRLMPDREAGWMRQKSSHPDIVHTRAEKFAAEVEQRRDRLETDKIRVRLTATSRGVEHLELAMRLLGALSDRRRVQVVWLRAGGMSYPKIARKLGGFKYPKEVARYHRSTLDLMLTKYVENQTSKM